MKRILFVCTGNTCRSPMAEGMLREMAEKAELELKVRSAGVSAVNGLPISGHASLILQEKGIEGTHVSRELSQTLVNWAELILTMTMGHKRQVIQMFPDAVERTYTLKEFVVEDPKKIEAMQEREQLLTERELKRALSQSMTAEEIRRLQELEKEIPDFDVADPFGGSLDQYQQCAEEIEADLRVLLRRLQEGGKSGEIRTD